MKVFIQVVLPIQCVPEKQNPETKGCCDKVLGCMTIIIYIS